jgi:hypothetical protein
MNYEEFLEFIPAKCMYETIYDDSNGYPILVIRLLDAYAMVNKLSQPTWFVDSKLNPIQRPWVGLTDEDIALIDWESLATKKDCVLAIEAALKEKNNG